MLESVGSKLPAERQQELDHLEEQVGSNIEAATSLVDPSERERMVKFLAKWDRETPEEQKKRISTAIELFGYKKLDPKALEIKKQSFVNDIAKVHEAKTRQSVRALSDREIREWDDLRSRETLNRGDQQRLKELEGRAMQEYDKALGAIGMEKGPIPLLVNPKVRKRYEQLLKDHKAREKIKALQIRLQIGKGPGAQPKEAPIAFTHETFRELLFKRTGDIKAALSKSGDYRRRTIPMDTLNYAEEKLIPEITADKNDLDGTLRLIQSMTDMSKETLIRWSEDTLSLREDILRVGTLRELAGMLPKQEASDSNTPSLSQEGLNQRKADLYKGLEDIRSSMGGSRDNRRWVLPTQACDTAKVLLGEINIGGVNQSAPGMIQDRLNTIEPIPRHFADRFSRR